jgi:hypothetical protein
MSYVQIKDPESVLDYTLDWADFLAAGETIDTSTWAVSPSGSLAIDDNSNTGATATVWLSAGTRREVYAATNTIETTEGRTEQRSITVRVEER